MSWRYGREEGEVSKTEHLGGGGGRNGKTGKNRNSFRLCDTGTKMRKLLAVLHSCLQAAKWQRSQEKAQDWKVLPSSLCVLQLTRAR